MLLDQKEIRERGVKDILIKIVNYRIVEPCSDPSIQLFMKLDRKTLLTLRSYLDRYLSLFKKVRHDTTQYDPLFFAAIET